MPPAGGKGGAIHNHEAAVTYMVNCILAGNSSTEEGGGIFNSRHTGSADVPAELYLHNCLIAGNMASSATSSLDIGGGVFNGLSGDDAEMEMVHCTLVGNYAEKYGGAANFGGSSDSTMLLRNSIVWANTDGDGSTDILDAELYYSANTLDDDHVDHNVIDDLDFDSDRFDVSMNEVNTESDPLFDDDGTSETWTGTADYDATTGQTEFTFSSCPSVSAGGLFRPDASIPLMLLVVSHDESGPNCIVTCWGYWSGSGTTGSGFDLHIDDSGSAWDFADAAYIASITNGGCGDVCDLNGVFGIDEPLPYDLDAETPNARNQNNAPDAGVYEIPE